MVNIDSDDNSFYKISGVAKEAWLLFSKGLSFEEIVQKILSSYDVSEDDLRKDLESFLTRLKELNFIED